EHVHDLAGHAHGDVAAGADDVTLVGGKVEGGGEEDVFTGVIDDFVGEVEVRTRIAVDIDRDHAQLAWLDVQFPAAGDRVRLGGHSQGRGGHGEACSRD